MKALSAKFANLKCKLIVIAAKLIKVSYLLLI